jgi:hypothetical protein
MGGPRCDFYDWVTRRACEAVARWVTNQKSQDTGRLERYYCDKHRPPRAHLIGAPGAAQDPKAR